MKFLGLGRGFCPSLSNTSAILTTSSEQLLVVFDCGSTVFSNIKSMLRNKEVFHFFLTSIRESSSLVECVKFLHRKGVSRQNIIVHGHIAIKILLVKNGCGKMMMFKTLHTDKVIKYEEYSIRPVPQLFVKDFICFGFLITKTSKRIFYSGNSIGSPQHIVDMFNRGEIDELYHDCSDDGSINHTSISWLADKIVASRRSQTYLTHLNKNFNVGEAMSLGFSLPRT